jgi:hypothetical protein
VSDGPSVQPGGLRRMVKSTARQSLTGRYHTRPIEWQVLLLEVFNYILLFPPINPPRPSPPAGFQLEQISNDLASEVPEKIQ